VRVTAPSRHYKHSLFFSSPPGRGEAAIHTYIHIYIYIFVYIYIYINSVPDLVTLDPLSRFVYIYIYFVLFFGGVYPAYYGNGWSYADGVHLITNRYPVHLITNRYPVHLMNNRYPGPNKLTLGLIATIRLDSARNTTRLNSLQIF